MADSSLATLLPPSIRETLRQLQGEPSFTQGIDTNDNEQWRLPYYRAKLNLHC
jgi:hypothetical protein